MLPPLPKISCLSLSSTFLTSLLNLKAVVGFASLVCHGHYWLAVCVASLHQLQEVVRTSVLVQVLDAIPTLRSLARPLVLLRIRY